jgi:hypothetical protein
VNDYTRYKEYRIHTSQLRSALWVSTIVRVGERKAMTNDSLTPAVTRVPGEYPAEVEALQAAMQYINHLEGTH